MQTHMTVREAAERWSLTERRVQLLCKQGRVAGAERTGDIWLIPAGTRQPPDLRRRAAPGPAEIPAFPVRQLYGSNTPIYQTEEAAGPVQPEEEGCVVTQYALFPGVSLAFHDIHAHHLDYQDMPAQFPPDMLSIQHCREGRFEGEYEDGACFYLGQGDLSINLPACSPVKNAFPLAHYHGCNLVVLPEPAMASIRALEQVLGPLAMDLEGLARGLQTGEHLAIFRSDPVIRRMLDQVYQAHAAGREGAVKLEILTLLSYLCSADASPAADRPYFSRGQVETVKEIREFLTAHLEEHYTLQALSNRFHLPLTALKTCFQGVFGLPLSAYLRAYRLQAAAELLRSTALPVGEIALRVGYESHSKFAAAFQKQTGQTPGRYRKLFVPPAQPAAFRSNGFPPKGSMLKL